MIGTFLKYKTTAELIDAKVFVGEISQGYKASISSNDASFGTVALSKTENLIYGEEITVTATPAEGYKVASVMLDDGSTNQKDITADMKFNASFKNEVIVTFVNEDAKIAKTYNVAFKKANQQDSCNQYVESWKNVSEGRTYTVKNCSNNNKGWDFIKAGRKADASVASIITDAPFAEAIGVASITFKKFNSTYVNSIKVVSASDAEFTNVIEEVSITGKANSTIKATFTKPSQNAYYKWILNLKASNKSVGNGFVEIDSLSFVEAI